MLTLASRLSKQRTPSWGSDQDLFLLSEWSQIRAAFQALLLLLVVEDGNTHATRDTVHCTVQSSYNKSYFDIEPK
jgi:hypothetical protein